MNFKLACTLDDLWEGDMTEVEVDGQVILLVWPEGGQIRAFQGMCPHQDIPLSEGRLEGGIVMCRAHQWTFDTTTGHGVNPKDCHLAQYPVKLEGESILVSTEGVSPLFAHT
ncbi:Rieske 2Fe-2S domain-containing protein [Xanthobacter agilis]|jgi:toluene monooxygenase system ferredoxin subunit|uniref:Toluene monooxygenase system ferredoxin subunit n=1 Tax=Xanthobacter agilis TaxID=47492 RepID=A0ABU0LJ27_XANAG|nr:Rieske 2Fe-2S domain-containing protein [Xanthobacter agilis]MDQ0507143.1 toluene monooxygenase system ferredoxin subunit [Xanthobacter agilis]